MKIRNLVILGIIVLLWEALLGHTRLFGAVELYPVLGALTLFDLKTRNIVSVFFLGIVVSFVAIETIGLASIDYAISLFVVLLINKFSGILTKEMDYIAVLVFLFSFRIILIITEYLLNGNLDLNIVNILIFLGTHMLFVYFFKYIIRPQDRDNSFIV